MSNPKLIPVPFAKTGTRTNIPVTRASNDASEMPDYDAGFPPITSTPLAAGGKAPRRQDFNGVLHDVTDNIRFLNSGGFFTFDAAFASKIGGYPKGAVLLSNDGSKKYVSLIDGNTSDFNVSVDETRWAKTALTERETQDIAWGVGKTSVPWAPLASPSFTGTPTAPTAAVATNTTQLASTAFVQNELNSRRYVSGELIMTNGGQITVSHGLGAMPTHATGWLKCVTADLGYEVGDMVLHPLSSDGTYRNEALTMTVTSTQLIVRVGENGPYLATRKDNGDADVFSAANWRLILKASL